MISVVHQTNYLLDRLLAQLEQAFSCSAGVLACEFRRRPAARMQTQIRARRPVNSHAGTPALLEP
jgi:hypothetical protein